MNNIFLYLVGTAGSGKSMLTYSFQEWMRLQGYDAVTVNLDPGVEQLNYSPDIDVREWLSLRQIMEEYGLGPNGAQIVCADLLAFKMEEVKKEIEKYETDYFLIDTPGQIELFAFRESSRQIVERLGSERALLGILFDPILARTPNGLVSQIVLSATIQFRFSIPSVNLLSKADILKEEEIAKVLKWTEAPYELFESAIQEVPSMQKQLSMELFEALKEVGAYKALIPISSETFIGMEDLYNTVQQVFYGGEDLEKR